jgi:hypothetical protein
MNRVTIDKNNPDTYVISKLNNQLYTRITHTHTKRYGMSIDSYCSQFNLTRQDIVCNALRQKLSWTRERSIDVYGEIEGLKRWEEYRKKQSITNTFEYKNKVYGISREEFDEYNKSRASTRTNFIKRHGEVEGIKRWNEYVKLQKYVGVKFEYFIEKYGKVEGGQKYYDMLEKKCHPKFTGMSKISQEFAKLIDNNSFNTFYASKNGEYTLKNKGGRFFSLDFYCAETNRGAEFFGDIWHRNPDRFQGHEHMLGFLTSDIWEKDKNRLKIIKESYNIDIIVVWESEFNKRREETIQKVKKFIYERS